MRIAIRLEVRTLLAAALLVCVATSATAQSVPAPWGSADVGSPAVAGSAATSFTVAGAGTDIWDTADQFRFMHQAMTGDGEIVARVVSFTNTHAWAKVGVMFRESLTADSPNAFMAITAANGYAFQRRPSPGATTLHTDGGTGTAPGWVRLVRRGDQFQAYRSADGSSWTLVGTETIPIGDTLYVGLAVTSHNPSTATTAVIDRVTLSAGPANQPPVVTITQPTNGTQVTAPATVTISATASDPENRLTSVQFYVEGTLIATDTTAPYSASWNATTAGTYALTARAQDADGGATTSNTVSVTVVAGNSPPTVTLTSPANNATFTAPATIALAATASDPNGTVARVEFFSGTTLLNTDTTAPYSFSWSNVAAGTYTLRAVAYDNAGASASSATRTVTVTSANQPPTAALTSPANNATFTAPATISLAATASDPNGTVARVEFFSGTTLLGTDTTSPYAFSWTNVPAGTYSLRAVAYDNAGASGNSATVTVTVTAPSTPPTTVVFGASSDHATNVTSYLLKVFPQGANPDTATPTATSDLGKPAPASNNDITVNRASFFSALAPGSYQATVTAIGPGGQTRSISVPFTR